jgi:hypothetical protein
MATLAALIGYAVSAQGAAASDLRALTEHVKNEALVSLAYDETVTVLKIAADEA